MRNINLLTFNLNCSFVSGEAFLNSYPLLLVGKSEHLTHTLQKSAEETVNYLIEGRAHKKAFSNTKCAFKRAYRR